MTSLILSLALIGQCPGGVCAAPQTRYSVAIVRPSVVYQASPQACTAPRRGVFKLFRRCK